MPLLHLEINNHPASPEMPGSVKEVGLPALTDGVDQMSVSGLLWFGSSIGYMDSSAGYHG